MSSQSIELRQFVSDTIIQIINGVTDAQKHTEKSAASVNPRKYKSASSQMIKETQLIEFNVAVSVIEGDETKGGIGVISSILMVGAQHTTGSESSTLSHIKFSVPISFPEQVYV